MNLESIHIAMSAAGMVSALAVFVVTLIIKNNQAELRADQDAKHAENKQALAVHVGRDEVMFDGISRTLTRMDTKLDKISDRQA